MSRDSRESAYDAERGRGPSVSQAAANKSGEWERLAM